MNDFKDAGDLRPAPAVPPTAALWVMSVVVVLATSALLWLQPKPAKALSASGELRCWPVCDRSGPRQRFDPMPQPVQATSKPPAKPVKTGA